MSGWIIHVISSVFAPPYAKRPKSLSLPHSNSFCILFLETQDLAAISPAHQKNNEFSEMSYPS